MNEPHGSGHPADPLRSLHTDPVHLPVVTRTYLLACAAVELTAFVAPALHARLEGVGPDREPWQYFTAVFVHGWPGVPSLIHFGLNAVLICACGAPCERLLGSARFLLISIASAGGNVLLQSVTEGINGASMVIWSWGPPLCMALVEARRMSADVLRTPAATRITGVLVIMYIAVTLGMTVIPYAGGWSGNLFVATWLGNRYHATATAIGVLFALAFRRTIRHRIKTALDLGP